MSQKKSFQLIIHLDNDDEPITTNHSNVYARKEYQREFDFRSRSKVRFENRTTMIDSKINFDRCVSDLLD